MIALVVDPGVRGCGVSLFHTADKELHRAAYVKNVYSSGNGLIECRAMATAVWYWVHETVRVSDADVTTFVGEWPQVYTTGKQKKGDGWADPNDLLPLTGILVGISMQYVRALPVRYLPREWKGQTDKPVMNARVRERLTEAELGRIESAGSLTHNVLDAVGIGLHHFGRLERKRVFAR